VQKSSIYSLYGRASVLAIIIAAIDISAIYCRGLIFFSIENGAYQ